MDMTFEDFFEVYKADVKPKLKREYLGIQRVYCAGQITSIFR